MISIILLSYFLFLILSIFASIVEGESFDRTYLYLSPKKLRTHFDITIEFRTLVDILPNSAIVIALPRFTRNFQESNFTYGNISAHDLVISPSYMFQAVFVEGKNIIDTTDNGTIPFADSHIILRSSKTTTISAYSTIPLKIYKENQIGAICGFPGSETLTEAGANIVPTKSFKIYTITTSQNSNIVVKNNDDTGFKYFDGIGEGCTKMKDCNGHGKCDYCYESCQCEEGYGASTDIAPLGVLNKNCGDSKFSAF